MKKSVLGGLAFLLSGCVTFHGNLDLAYVPVRVDDITERNELKVKTEVWGEIPMGESILYAGGAQTSFSDLPDFKDGLGDYEFYSKRMVFDAYFGWKFDRIDFYFNHMCSHPLMEEHVITLDEEYNQRILGHDVFEEIGVRINF